MTRLRGWGRKGKPLPGKAPHGHWMTSTFVAGLRHDGIAAPMLIDTPMTGRIFQQWLTNHLIPELPPGSIVVCDNLPAHNVEGVRQCLEDAGMGLLYLPPYSLRLQPDRAGLRQTHAARGCIGRRPLQERPAERPRGYLAADARRRSRSQFYSATRFRRGGATPTKSSDTVQRFAMSARAKGRDRCRRRIARQPYQLAPSLVVAYAAGMAQELGKRPPGRPRDPAKREALIRAARGLFLERGSDAVTLDQVLARAAVSRATLYSNFSDKGDLLAAVVGAEAERFLTGEWARPSSDQPIETILVRFGDGLLAFIADPDTLAFERLIAQAAFADPEYSTRFFAAGPGKARGILVVLIEAAQERSELAPGDAEQAANDLLGLWQGMWRLEIQYGHRVGIEPAELHRLVRHGVWQFLRLYAAPT